jgi:hypothetical protein
MAMLLGYIDILEKTVRQPQPKDEAAEPKAESDESRWVRIEQTILKALLALPEALRAVSRAVAAMEPASSG